MATLAETARVWQQAGVSVIPVLANGTKRPAVRWGEYQVAAPTLGVIDEWWSNGHTYGLALICGKVSGNLELVELEGRALSTENLTEVVNRCDELGVGWLWELLTGPEGYSQTSPSGGLHLLYRITDHEVPGNTKLAQNELRECLAETRGEGGYVIAAPTSGLCHPSGESWDVLAGTPGVVASITWEDRCRLHEAIALALNRQTMPGPPSPTTLALPAQPSATNSPSPTSTTQSSTYLAPTTTHPVPALASPTNPPGPGLTTPTSLPEPNQAFTTTPGDEYEQRTDWYDILTPHGWQLSHRGAGTERHWTRPGKEIRDGISATTGRANDRDRLYVFSTSTLFPSETPITKFGAYAMLNHGGDFKAAAVALVQEYGSRKSVPAQLETMTRPPAPNVEETFTWDDVGNGLRFKRFIENRFRWVYEEKCWFAWTGDNWVPDTGGAVSREWMLMTRAMRAKAKLDGDQDAEKWAKACGSVAKMTAALVFTKAAYMTHSAAEFNQQRHLLNVHNGTLNLETGEFASHCREDLITHMFGTAYDPEATCPNFESFMEQALPDQELRSYVQRSLGYSLLGNADQRALFVLHGPSGTGKSTILETIGEVFGTYATTAQAGTFRAAKSDKGPSNDLHELRGRRFVTTSETAENASFDEDLLKRITGRDKVRSRALYQESQEWTPECTIWMATNNPPRLNSDDDAIWRRLKLIPMTTVFRGPNEVFDYARRILVPEAAGILNWLLAGLRAFQEHGLGEPETLQIQAEEQRTASDSVARFIGDKLSDASLVEGPGTIKATELFSAYADWCRQVGEKSLGSRRFMLRMDSHMAQYDKTRDSNGVMYFSGLHRPTGSWLVQYNINS